MSKQIHPRLPNGEVWDDFKEFVQEKYGSNHSVVGQEVEKALIQYMAAKEYKNYSKIAEMLHNHNKK